jgi:hypothetical protein
MKYVPALFFLTIILFYSCSVSAVYKPGNNYFINSEWIYCEGDAGGQIVPEIRANGLKEEVRFK